MNKTLIIYAHPNKKGHNGKVLEFIKEELKTKKEKATIIDLYKTQFDPRLSTDELTTNYNTYVSQQTKKFQDLLKQSSHLIFIYPTWWQNVPAILKGFIDKIFRAGFVADFSTKIPTPLMKGKKAIILTTASESKLIAKCIYNNRSIKVLKKDVLELSGIKTKGFLIDNSKKLEQKQIEKIRRTTKKATKWLYK